MKPRDTPTKEWIECVCITSGNGGWVTALVCGKCGALVVEHSSILHRMSCWKEKPISVDTCLCHYCSSDRANALSRDGDVWGAMQLTNRMIVCPKCGNKRCPHATNHRNTCTGSNESGQEGSRY